MNSIQFVISFLANIIILASFFGIIDIFYPIRVSVLTTIMGFLFIPCNSKNIVVFLSAVCILIPVVLHRTDIMMKYALWTLDSRKPDENELIKLEKAMTIVCNHNYEDIENYQLYVSDLDEENAMSLGKEIIIITKKLLDAPENEISIQSIAGLLAHEVGHFKNGRNYVYLVTNAMGMIGNAVIDLFNIIRVIFLKITGIPIFGFLFSIIAYFLKFLIFIQKMFLKLPQVIVTGVNSRESEYEADRYACEIGMGKSLYSGLSYISRNNIETTWADKYLSTHPDAQNRLEQIKEYVVSHEQLVEK